MISTELIRRYPFFAGLNLYQNGVLAMAAEEYSVDAGHRFFNPDEELTKFYFLLEGKVDINVLPVGENMYASNPSKDGVPVISVGVGEMFGWSALIPPHKSTATVKSSTPCRVIEFDCEKLWPFFEEDSRFAYLMSMKAAQTIRERLRNMHIESLAFIPE